MYIPNRFGYSLITSHLLTLNSDRYLIISLEDENDYKKINDCLWKGFNHGDNPDDDIDRRIHMQCGPNFRKELTTVIKAPNGDYACYAGMWFDEKNNYAYLEPLATVYIADKINRLQLKRKNKTLGKYILRWCA